MIRRRRVAACLLTLAATALGQSSYDAVKADLQKRTDAARQAAAGDPDQKVWDFVIADKKAKTVTLLACATHIQPTDPVEFFVAPVLSGKDYEALAVTFATPADVRAAFDFIGLSPGRPIDPDQNRFWPRGPRVVMTFDMARKPVPAEALVLDARTKKPLPAAGLVYTGSYTYTDAQGKTHVAADDSDARPIAPTYNDSAALFDVPEQASQSAVYGTRKPSPAFTARAGDGIDVTIAAATGDAAVPWWVATVEAAMVDDKARFSVQSHSAMRDAFEPLPPTAADDLPHFLASLGRQTDGRRDLFTTVRIDAAVPVSEVRKLYAVLESVERDRGVKIDPPRDGDLFHRAFFPDPAWRDRATRLGEPWELFLTRRRDGTLGAKLERSVDNPDRNAAEAKLVESMTPAGPAAFAAHVKANVTQWSRTVFVYPPADLTYGELMAWVRPVLATYPRVFVFPADAAASRPG